MINSGKKGVGNNYGIHFSQVLQRKKTESELVLYCYCPDSKPQFGCVEQKSSSPCFEVCDAEAVGGVQANPAIPNHAAQQRSQLRRDPVQGDLRGHVVHFNQLKTCMDTFTTQHTALMIGSLYAVQKLLLFTTKNILITQNLTIRMGRQIEVVWQSNLIVTRLRQKRAAAELYCKLLKHI